MKWYLLYLMLLSGCVTTPHSKRTQLNFIPKQQMHSLGRQSYEEIKKKEQLIKSGPVYDQVVKIGKRIAAASGVGFDWEFAVIKNDKMLNAFCLPGGKIAVYTGILPTAANEAGLAAILGHEVAHAVLRHGAERMSQALILQLGLTAAQVSMKNSKQKGVIMAALGLGAQFGVMMPFSRSHESEADKIGLRYMAKAGYDPSEAPKLWQRMAKKGGGVPEILSTHPDPLKRARALQKQIPSVNGFYQASRKQASRRLAY